MQAQTLETLGALALDLKRASLAFWNGSTSTGERFIAEVVTRQGEVNMDEVDTRTRNVLAALPGVFSQDDTKKKAEDLLMYSTLVQNRVTISLKLLS